MARSEGAVEAFVSTALHLAWEFRLELTLAIGAWWCWSLANGELGSQLGTLVMALACTALLGMPRSRQALWRALRVSRVRRRFRSACRLSHFDKVSERVPSVLKADETPAGFRLLVRVPGGTAVSELEDMAEVAAASMAVRDVRVRRDPTNASLATVSVIERDPLSDPEPLDWEWLNAGRTDLWQPVPVGLDEDGNPIRLSLVEHNVLLGGEPGAGKSAALSILLAAAALDPSVCLWLLDGKQVELAPWAACARAFVGTDVAEATSVLRSIQAEMDIRYGELLHEGKRKISPGDGHPLHVVACDELALYLASGDKRDRTECAEALRDLVARGRAAGVIVLAATHKPGSDIVPTSLRDLFGFRWAMRCATREASDTILGSGWATEGYSAATIDAASRGVGYLLHEGGLPVRLKAAYLDDGAVKLLADRAAQLRGSLR